MAFVLGEQTSRIETRSFWTGARTLEIQDGEDVDVLWSPLQIKFVWSPWNPDKEHGFDANQSVPGNMLWEELYAASPKGQKVIWSHKRSQKVIKELRSSWLFENRTNGGGKVGKDLWNKKLKDLDLEASTWAPFLMKERIWTLEQSGCRTVQGWFMYTE